MDPAAIPLVNMSTPITMKLTSSPQLDRPKVGPMRGFGYDPKPLQIFKGKAQNPEGEQLTMRVFEWNQGDTKGQAETLDSVAELRNREPCSVRVIFAPLDIPHSKTVDGLTALFEEYNFPSDFVSERIHSVTQSFGTRMDENGTQCSWFHFLCKNINTIYENGVLAIHNPPPSKEQSGKVPQQSQADFSWIRAGFMLKSEQLKRQPNPGNKSTSSSSSSTRTHVNNSVTLICFGAPRSLVDRFENLAEDSGCEDALQDPYVLFDLVLDELYKLVDDIAWRLSEIFGKIETDTLYTAKIPSKTANQTAYKFDFVGLHNVAKHVIYLCETSESALLTAESLCARHKQLIGDNPNAPSASTQSSLLYRKGLFQSTQRRLMSMDRRMGNIISLSFNLVTQLDSLAIQKDSKSMKTIAVMTMFFLPVSTVATIFGAQFFTVGSEAPSHLQISPDFWILWAIAAPFTLVVLIVWRLWHLKAKYSLAKGQQLRGGAGAVVLEWKAWLEKMGKRKKDDVERRANCDRRPVSYVRIDQGCLSHST